MNSALHARAREIVQIEGLLLDERDWDGWLGLYAVDAKYWLPCWIDEYTLTNDPQTQMSLIYYPDRSGLEDRVYRLRTERSLASTPLPRTCHITSIGRVTDLPDGSIKIDSNWTTHSFRLAQTHSFFGQQSHVLRLVGDSLLIVGRTIILANDVIPNVLDIYSI
jgi:benzoate/toluate 1,2-dioxygenase beta subunit